jgi:hypothetical protein
MDLYRAAVTKYGKVQKGESHDASLKKEGQNCANRNFQSYELPLV